MMRDTQRLPQNQRAGISTSQEVGEKFLEEMVLTRRPAEQAGIKQTEERRRGKAHS